MNEIVNSGWCCLHLERCTSRVGCECVRVDGAEMCVPCGARQVGLPKDATAEEVLRTLAELSESMASPEMMV